MKTRNYFILYSAIALCLFGYYQYSDLEYQKKRKEAEIHSQQLNRTLDNIIHKSNVVLKILEETQADLEETSRDLGEVKRILKSRNKNEK